MFKELYQKVKGYVEKAKDFVVEAKGGVKKVALAVFGGVVTALSMTSMSYAAAQDYTGIQTGVSAEITAIIPIALGVLAMTIGIPMAVRVFKSVAR